MKSTKIFSPGGPAGLPATLLAMAVLCAASCDSCSGGSGTGGGGGSTGGGGWLVGEMALMLNVDHADPGAPGGVGRYDLDLDDDLLGIACRGTREAWVVGGKGLLIATADTGASWTVLDSGTTATLRAVALAAPNHVLVAGDDGVVRLSPDGGRHFRSLAVPALRSSSDRFTSAALRRADGQVALLASESGALYRWEAATGSVTEVKPAGGGALRSVVFARDGLTAAAVGDGGQMFVSRDGGQSFVVRATGSALALRDVWLVGVTGDRFVAVGEAGVLVEGETHGTGAQVRSIDAAASLRALHLEASGHGTVVGDRGAAFFTTDFGASWTRIVTGDTRNIYGVDALDFGAEHH